MYRLVHWGYKVDQMWIVCRSKLEAWDYLFYECVLAIRVWELILTKCLIGGKVADLDEEVPTKVLNPKINTILVVTISN
jgi:hypothetical protein